MFPVAKLCFVWAFDADLVKIFFPVQQFRAQIKLLLNQNFAKITPFCQNLTLANITPCQYHTPADITPAKIKPLPNLGNAKSGRRQA